jgi:PilZ domain
MNQTAAMVQPVSRSTPEGETRAFARHACVMQATSQPLDEVETISWGAIVDNLSAGGVGITLCYPFRPGTYLAVELQRTSGHRRTVLVRVVHVRDGIDGVWHLGCEFVKPLTDSDVEVMI